MNDPSPASTRIWWLVGWGLVAALCLTAIRYGVSLSKVPLGPPQLEGTDLVQPADYRWTPLDLNDGPVEFGRYRGKVVFLNIWATWCPPCVAELPSIARLAAEPRLKDVAFVCVATDDSPESIRAFLRDKAWPMTILRATELPEVFLTDGIPATFLIAPDGRVAAFALGSAEWDDPSVVAFLERLATPAPVKP